MITAQEEYKGWQSEEDMDVAERASSSGMCGYVNELLWMFELLWVSVGLALV